jgi:DNA-binding transcriptional ArsR family regulator
MSGKGRGQPVSATEDLKPASQTFSALGNTVRLRILLMLMDSKKPLHITAVASNLKMDYGGVHRHVEILRNAGLLQVFEVGRSRVLSPLNIEQVRDFITRAKDFSKKR